MLGKKTRNNLRDVRAILKAYKLDPKTYAPENTVALVQFKHNGNCEMWENRGFGTECTCNNLKVKGYGFQVDHSGENFFSMPYDCPIEEYVVGRFYGETERELSFKEVIKALHI